MKTPKALPYVLACSAVMLWTGDLTGQVLNGVRGPTGPVIPDLLRYDLQTLDLPATVLAPFTAQVLLGGQMQTLVLEPYTLRADDFQVLVQGEDGQLRQVEPPPPRTYRGTVQGEPLSRVAATLIDRQLSAVVALESGQVWYIQPLSKVALGGGPNPSHVIYQGEDVAAVDGVCGTDDIPQPLANQGDRPPGGDPTAGTGLQTTDIAFDADFEFYLFNGGSVPATVADIEFVMGGVEFVYERDTDITYEITVVVVRTNNMDPYTTNDPGGLLNQFRNTWQTAPEATIRRDVAQLFTGHIISNGVLGIAWVGTVCNVGGMAYSVVRSRFTTNTDLRVSLSSHELGHNWNALHCSGGTCHIMCGIINSCGGTQGANLIFGPVSVSAIVNFRNSRTCLFEQPLTLVPPFFDDLNVVIDTDKWTYIFGAFTTSLGVNEPSEPRSLQLDGGPGIYHKDEIRTNFIDMVGQTGSVLSYYTEHIGVEAGESLIVEYWAQNNTWKPLNVIVSDGVNQTEYDFFTHDLPADAMHDEFRVRFRTDINEFNDDWYVDDVFIGMADSCTWDLDGGGDVGVGDLLILLANWGNPYGVPDLLEMLANWGPCP